MPNYQKAACLFPGQGAQYPGLGKDLYEQFAIVRDTYAEASDALGYDMAALSFHATASKINQTRYTQPALLTHSIACWRALHQQIAHALPVCLAAGHSLGEYSALVCADALSFTTALQLVSKRGQLMSEYGQGEMAALMLDLETAATLAGQYYCGIAACNLPEQTVVGGTSADLERLLSAMATQFPRKRSIRLKTEGAFHTYHMVDAALQFRETLEQVEFKTPRWQVLSNFTGDFHDANLTALKSRLFLQLFNPVLWHKNLLQIEGSGADVWLEFGGGLGAGEAPADKRPNLESMAKKTWRKAAQAPDYLAVINTQTLQKSVSALA